MGISFQKIKILLESLISRMEILYLEGGIYQDTDAHPNQPFDNFGGIFRWPFASYGTSYKVRDV